MRSALLVAALAMMVCGFTGCSITGTPGGNGSCDGLTAGGCDSFAGGCDGRLIVSRRCGGSCQDCAGGRFFGRLPCRTIASPGLCGIGTKLGWNGIGCSSCGGGATAPPQANPAVRVRIEPAVTPKEATPPTGVVQSAELEQCRPYASGCALDENTLAALHLGSPLVPGVDLVDHFAASLQQQYLNILVVGLDNDRAMRCPHVHDHRNDGGSDQRKPDPGTD